jgi:hypothetical protein
MTMYQGTKVPPHSYLQYMNIDLYEIHIASISFIRPSPLHIFYYINVKLLNLDLKLGIKPKAGNFLSGKREGEGGGGERD